MRQMLTNRIARLLVRAAMVAAALLGAVTRGDANTFSVSPTRIELKPTAATTMLTVTNTSDRPTRFQLSAFTWDQREDGTMALGETSAIVFYPPLVEIAPGQSRRIRIGTTAPFSAVEQTFRIFVEELPDLAERPNAELGIQVRAKMGIPIFVGSTRPVLAATLQNLVARDGTVGFDLANTGSVHLVPTSVKLIGLSDTGARVFQQPITAWYLLAGHRLALKSAVEPTACASVTTVLVDVQFENGQLSDRLILPRSFCAR